jgi:hypothetical protein
MITNMPIYRRMQSSRGQVVHIGSPIIRHYAGMHGLGDNIYQRAYLAQAGATAAESSRFIALSTPWPELYADLDGIKVVRPKSRLRTQARNEEGSAAEWHTGDLRQIPSQRIEYGPQDLVRGISIIRSMGRFFPGITVERLSLPAQLTDQPWHIDTKLPIAFIRPATVRAEWRNEARNCRPEYVAEIAEALMRRYFVVSIADLQEGVEWPVNGLLPPAHMRLHAGELSSMQMLDLARRAAVAVGPVGWLAPFGIAAPETPTFIVLGGQLAHNGPEVIAPEALGPGRLGFAYPDNLCNCANMRHQCDKRISDPMGQFRAWADQTGIAL